MVGGVVVLVGLGIENTMVSIPSFVNTYELRKCYLRTNEGTNERKSNKQGTSGIEVCVCRVFVYTV